MIASAMGALALCIDEIFAANDNFARPSYDAESNLAAITKNGTTAKFLYDGVDLIAEYDGSNNLLRRYVHGGGMDNPLVWYEGSGTTNKRYLHADNQGSIIATTDSSGGVLNISTYDGYGVRTNTNAAYASRFGYTGQIDLPEVGLTYYKARIYNPNLGRFLQTDPIGYGAGLNLYAYVGGDPVNMVDPWGLDPWGFAKEKKKKEEEQSGVVTVWGPRRLSSIGFYYTGGRLSGYSITTPGETVVTVIGQRRRKSRSEPRFPHYYRIETQNFFCSADSAFDEWEKAGISAPGGAAARDGTTELILNGNNPIIQEVNSRDRSIINTTEFGHVFYYGDVSIKVTPNLFGSKSTVVGKGVNYNPGLVFANMAVGTAFFGMNSKLVATTCNRF